MHTSKNLYKLSNSRDNKAYDLLASRKMLTPAALWFRLRAEVSFPGAPSEVDPKHGKILKKLSKKNIFWKAEIASS